MDFLSFYRFYSAYIVPVSALIPLYLGVKNYRYLPNAFKILFTFIIVSSLINVVNLVMISRGMYTVQIIHWYTIVEFAFISLIFSTIFNKKWRIPIYVLIILFAALCIINFIYIQNKIEFNTYTRPIGALIIIIFCMCYIIKTGNEERKWTDDSFNWINVGLLLYYASGMAMFIFSNYLLKLTTFTIAIWTLLDTILLIEYILFAVGFNKCRSLTTTTSIS